MSLTRRIAMLFRAKANKALDRAEDPREMLDYLSRDARPGPPGRPYLVPGRPGWRG